MIRNPFKLLADLQEKPPLIPSGLIKSKMSDEDKKMLRQIGITSSQIRSDLQLDTQINYDRARLYHEIDRACFVGETRIWLLNNSTPSFREMVESSDRYIGKYTLSINPITLELEPDKIIGVKKTRENTQLVRVYLDNGEHIDCTPDHRFMLRNGLYKEAQYLELNDSLMPLYTKIHKRGLAGYLGVYNPKTNTWPYIHQLVAKSCLDYEKNKGDIVHHKWNEEKRIFDVFDNDPSSLGIRESKEHKSYHAKICIRKHKEDCACCYCVQTRGENKYSFKKGNIPWNKDLTKETDSRLKKISEENTIIKAFRTKFCECNCGGQFRCIIVPEWQSGQRFIYGHNRKNMSNSNEHKNGQSEGMKRTWARKKQLVLNHKVVKVEWLTKKQDTYDLTTEKNHNFPLAAGIFVHNSEHWLVGAAIELFADYCTCYSPFHNASVWITSESPTYQKELTKMLDRIGIEEKIFDWAWTTGAYGDLFVRINGIPELGVISVNDGDHPLNMSRVDHEGVLVGFYRTPQGQYAGDSRQLLPPWEFSHFRLLGAKKKRPMYGDPLYAEFRTMHLLIGTSTRQVTTRYGTSLILNGLPVYKRLRLAEDCLLMARLTRGILRYIWKLKVDSFNMEAVGELVDQYASLIKRARALDTSAGSPYYDSKANPMGVMEDLFIPIWGDTGDLTYDEIGGEADIKWIVDIEELRNQLACALRTPLSLLGGFVKDATGALGSESIEKLDIRFARGSRRLQRSLKQGIKRICQVHLAYMNMDPDPNLFDVEMSETSTAEETELREALESGTDVVQAILDLVSDVEGINKKKVINYLNQKVLKLEDFDLDNFMDSKEVLPESKKLIKKVGERQPIFDLDITSYLPLKESKNEVWRAKTAEIWEKKFGQVKVVDTPFAEASRGGNIRQGRFGFA